MKFMQLFPLFALLNGVATASSAQDSYLPASRDSSWDAPQSNADIVKSYFDRMATKTTSTTMAATATTTATAALRLPKMHHVRLHHHEKVDTLKPPVKVEMPHRRFAKEFEQFAKAKASEIQVEATYLPPSWTNHEKPRSNAEIVQGYFDRVKTATTTTTTTTILKLPKQHHVRLHRHLAKKDNPPMAVEAPHARFAKEFEKYTKAHEHSARSTEGKHHGSTSTTRTTSTTTTLHQEYQLPHGHPLRIVPHRNPMTL